MSKFPHHGDATPGSTVFVSVTKIDQARTLWPRTLARTCRVD
jgi:hypothetical protein